jgi:hypothetical protein
MTLESAVAEAIKELDRMASDCHSMTRLTFRDAAGDIAEKLRTALRETKQEASADAQDAAIF